MNKAMRRLDLPTSYLDPVPSRLHFVLLEAFVGRFTTTAAPFHAFPANDYKDARKRKMTTTVGRHENRLSAHSSLRPTPLELRL